jgi:predicted dehydrogenase
MPIKNVAIIGSNFGISGYLPALKKNKNYKIVLICCRSDE